jgi:hypothetical protein
VNSSSIFTIVITSTFKKVVCHVTLRWYWLTDKPVFRRITPEDHLGKMTLEQLTLDELSCCRKYQIRIIRRALFDTVKRDTWLKLRSSVPRLSLRYQAIETEIEPLSAKTQICKLSTVLVSQDWVSGLGQFGVLMLLKNKTKAGWDSDFECQDPDLQTFYR